MARTTLFSRLRRIAAMAAWGRREGVHDPGTLIERWQALELRRRDFGRIAVGAASAAVLPGIGGCAEDVEEPLRIAIVGAGLAGLHCAYRLQQAGVTVTLYEATSRAGGRAHTAREMFPDGQIAELGGEFIDSGHATMLMLAEEFGFTLDPRADPSVVADTWWIGGAAVPEDVVVEQFTAVAPLMLELVTAADSDDAVYEMLDAISMREWLAENVPVDTYPELNAILESAYRGEYGLETDEQSVLNLLYLIGSDDPDPFRIFGISDEAYHCHEGNSAFAERMASQLGGSVRAEHRLLSVSDAADGSVALHFETPDGGLEVVADHVVLAIPFTILRSCDLSGLTLSSDKRTIIDELGYGTNAKVMAAFTERVWRTQHGASGSVTSDLPLQQTWDTSIGQSGDHGILTQFLGGGQGEVAGDGTPEAWIQANFLPGIEEVFPGTADAYIVESGVRMHWPTYPYTLGSYACYRPGQWAYYGIEGAREGNVHFCGEHCSLEYQGYMEGAAETGALVAMAILGDLGIAMSEAHERVIAPKLAVPQPAVEGRLPQRPRFLARRHAIVRAWMDMRVVD